MEPEKEKQPVRVEILAIVNKHHLMMAGYSAVDIVGFGDLGGLTRDRMHERLHKKNLEALAQAISSGAKIELFHKPPPIKKRRVVRKVVRRRTG